MLLLSETCQGILLGRALRGVVLNLADDGRARRLVKPSARSIGVWWCGVVLLAVRASLRSSDVAARYGGDEFIVLLDGCDDEGAARIVHRIRHTVGALSSGAGEPISLSAGIASFPACGDDLDELIRQADDALFVAKRAGKNDVRHALAADRA